MGLYWLILRFPVALPLGMTLWNISYFVMTLVFTGYVKVNVLRYSFMYALCIKDAYHGDLTKFMIVISSTSL
jgi:hypothetical protein